MNYIENQKRVWSDKDEDILGAIRRGFRQTHLAMLVESKSLPNSVYEVHISRTTATAALFKNGRIYTGHVGDTSILLGYQDDGEVLWKELPLTKVH
jgi:protein phosphatase 1D